MYRRQSMSNGYPIPSGMKLVPASPQPEPIPMMNGTMQPYQPIPMLSQYKPPPMGYNNSMQNNRVAPPRSDYNSYAQPNNSFPTHSSMNSTKPLIQTSQMYSNRQQPSAMYGNNPNQSYGLYNQQNNQMGISDGGLPVDELESKNKPISWFRKPLCLGLTRLSGGVLFGTMALLCAVSLGGLITSVVLYVTNTSTDTQWKILGMVVCAIMLLTIIVTLCVFIYCHKHGRIIGNNNNNNSLIPQQQNRNEYQNSNLQQSYGYNQPYDSSPIPYGMMQNISPSFSNEDHVQVTDKLTNTETTTAPLRPRDFQRGVWPAPNLYGGSTQRPIVPPKVSSRFIQAVPNDIDQAVQQRRIQASNGGPKTVIRRPASRITYIEEQQPPARRVTEQPPYQIVEEIIIKPRARPVEEYVEIIEAPRRGREHIEKNTGKPKYGKVSVKRVVKNEEPNDIADDDNTDHFYQ